MSFTDNYLKLRQQRQEKNNTDGITPSVSVKQGATSQAQGTEKDYASNYLKLRQQRTAPQITQPTTFTMPKKRDSSTAGTEEPKQVMTQAEEESEPDEEERKVMGFGGKRTEDGIVPLEVSPKAEKVDYSKLLAGMVMKGINQFDKGLTSTADWLIGQPLKALGWENNPISALNQKITEEGQYFNEKYAENASKSQAAQLIDKYGAATVAAIPQAALALVTAGSSLAAQGTTAGLEAASAAANTTGLAGTIGNAIQGMAKNPQYWASFLQVAGTGYEQAKEDGASDLKASAYAMTNGLINAMVEIGGGGIQELPAELKSGGSSAVRKWVDTMLDEGKEEVVQGVIERGLQNVIYQKNNPLFSTTDENAIFNPKTMLEEAAGGAVVGGVLGGGQMAVDSMARRAAAPSGQNSPSVPAETQAASNSGESAKRGIIIPETPKTGEKTAESEPSGPLKIDLPGGENTDTYESRMAEFERRKAAAVADWDNVSPEEVRWILDEEKRLAEEKRTASEAESRPLGIVLPTAEQGGMLPTAETTERQMAGMTLEESGTAAGVSEESIAQAQRLSKAIGRNIQFYRAAATETGIQNGYYDPAKQTIYVNAASQNPVAQIIAHELTHSVELADSYRELSGLVLRRIRQTGGNLRQMRQEKRELYARNGVELQSESEIDQEIVAEYVEQHLLTDEQSILELTRQEPTLGRRILNWLNEMLAKLGINSAQERDFLIKARDAYARALEQAGTGVETETELKNIREAYQRGEMSDEDFDDAMDAIMQDESQAGRSMLERNSFAGEKASGADMEALQTAKEMEAQDVAPETIRQSTGWFKGADGKWRWEIDDSGMEYNRQGFARNPDEARKRELMDKFLYGDITQEEAEELRALEQATKGMPEQTRLADYIKHEELFAEYPELRDVTLRFAELESGAKGQYDREENTITLSRDLKNAPEDTLIHEIQHAIQNTEGFSAGSSPEYWAAKDYENGEITKRLRLERRDAFRELSREDQNKYARYKELERELERLETAEDGTEDAERYVKFDRESDALYLELWEKPWFQKLVTLDRKLESGLGEEYNRLYRNTAGEIEARDAAKRRTMTPEQRRATPPDTGDENTVFAEGAEEYSAEASTRLPAGNETDDALKGQQFRIIRESNPAPDDYHTWIRSADEIKTFEEALADPEWDYDVFDPDYTRAAAESAMRSGKITVYSSYPIRQGVFVSPSKMEAESYSGTGRVYKKTVKLTDVAWIDPTQGQYAATEGSGARFSISEEEQEPTGPLKAELPGGEKQPDGVISSLPVKAQNYLRRVENTLLNKIGKNLSVPRFAQRGFLRDIVREISTEYLRDGAVSQNTLDRLFETAYEEGVVADREFYDTYKGIKDYLRTQAVTLTETDRADIADFNSFRKSMFGTLRIVNEGGLPVDTAYQELQEMAPALFPTEITHPADQLVRMAEVGQSIRVVEKSLDEYYGHDAEEFKRWAKNGFNVAVNDVLGELRQVKRYADDRTQSQTETKPLTLQEVRALYPKLKDARKAYEKVQAKNLLTQHDEIQVGRLLRGEMELEALDPAKDNVKGITAVYQAKREYEQMASQIREWNQARKAELRQKADGYLQTANTWKDKKAGILYSRETMERNILDIVEDKELAKEINNEYFKPVHDAQAEATRTKNKYRDRVRALNLSRKVAKGNAVSESHAVQLLGEAEDNIRMLEQSRGRMKVRDGKSLADWKGIVDKLWAENPNLNQAKIRGAVQEFRKIYDELFEQMNETRIRNGYEPVNYRSGYFPHFQPGDGDGILVQFGKAMGIDTSVTALPTTINGLTHTFRPGIQWFGNAQERLGFNTAYDAVEGFDKYIEGVADVIHQTDNIQNLRALATQMRYRTGDEGIRQQVDAVRAKDTLSEAEKQNEIDKIYEDGKYTLSNFVVELEEYTNLLANKKSRADRNMEQALGRRSYNLVKTLESRVAANMVAVNPASWLTNFIPLTQGNAMLDRGMLLKGMWDTLKAYKTDDGIVAKSSFLTNRRGSDPIVRTWVQSASAKASAPMEYIDQFTADSLVRARYSQNLKKGLSEDAAMSEADAWVAGVMADRSKGSTPTLFNRSNPFTKLFTQFQLEVNNQLSYLFKDVPRETKDKGLLALGAALIKFFLGAFLYDEIYEYFIGRRPALDPLGILNDTVGDLTGYELPNLVELGVGAATGELPSLQVEKKNAYDTVTGLAGNVAEELPFIGGVLGGGRVPISSALPSAENLAKAVLSDNWSGKKRLATAANELLGKPITYLAPPFGGGQIKKIYQGLEAVIKGGSYSVDTEGNDILQYPVYRDSPLQAAMSATGAILFGKTSLPTGREWIESGFKSLGAKETACYQGMMDAGVSGGDAFELLKTLRGAQKTDTETEAQQERRLLKESDVSGEGKSIVYYGLMATDSERVLMDALADMGADMGEVTNVLMEIKDAEKLTGAAASNAKRDAIAGAALTEEEKIELYRDRISDSRDDDIADFQKAGLSFEQFLQVQNEYSSINEDYTSAGEKAMEFSRWVNGQKLTAAQTETVKECFKYYSQMPAEARNYDSFIDAGLEDDTAYDLANAITALEPEEGKDQVSDVQKWRAVIDTVGGTEEQMQALSSVMTEAQYAKLQIGYDFDVEPSVYVRLKEELPKYDADGNGSYKNEEIEAAIDGMTGGYGGIFLPTADGSGPLNLTTAQKAALWQLMTGSTSAKNNPYSSEVGQKVLDTKNGTGESGTTYTGGIVLPTA